MILFSATDDFGTTFTVTKEDNNHIILQLAYDDSIISFVVKDDQKRNLDDRKISQLFSAFLDDNLTAFVTELPEVSQDTWIPLRDKESMLDDLTDEDITKLQKDVQLLVAGLYFVQARRSSQREIELQQLKHVFSNMNIQMSDEILDKLVLDMYQNGIRVVETNDEKGDDHA